MTVITCTDRDDERDALVFDCQWGSIFTRQRDRTATFHISREDAYILGQQLIGYANANGDTK